MIPRIGALPRLAKSVCIRQHQGQSYLPDRQTSLEDRYYNNQSFQEEFPVNDPEINHAATKIQAKFRGHKARQGVEKMKYETKQIADADQQELGYGREQSITSNEDEVQKSSRVGSARSQQQDNKNDLVMSEDHPFEEELTEAEKEEQERAARSIQAKFRGFQSRKSPHKESESPVSAEEQKLVSRRRQQQESENERTPTPTSTRLSGKIDSDRQDLGGNLTANDQNDASENGDTSRPRLEREPTQLSADFERHTQVPRDSDFDREQQPGFDNDEDDMNDPQLDKAATRIQASYRGYKIRKELGSPTGQSDTEHDQHPSSTSPRTHDGYDSARNKNILSPSAEGNKVPEGEEEEDDAAAAVKIQAAYRGYRARKDLEK